MALRLMISKQQVLERKLDLQRKLNLPLSIALYETDATCVTFYLLRDLPALSNVDLQVADEVTTAKSYKSNALIQNVPKDLRFERIECVAELDFSNMYATIITIYNLSPEYVFYKGHEDPSKSYDYITVNGNTICIQNTCRQGYLANLVSSLIEERNNLKHQGLSDVHIKKIITTIYGIMG